MTSAETETLKQFRANGLLQEASDLERRILERDMSKAKADIMQPKCYTTEQWLAKLITQCPFMQEQKEMVKKLKDLPDSVLIIGPTGTGKELLAQALHGVRLGEFVELNCAGLPVNLIEHELFGSVKGAFTGSDRTKEGLFTTARGGTLFLDEIGELPLDVQAKLLRAVETYRIRKVGGTKIEEIDCRFVAATKQPLEERVKNGTFREDLYYRLSTFQLNTTALSERLADCQLIADYYFKDKFPFSGWKDVECHLRGNVRTIKALVRRYQVFGKIIW